MLDNKTLYSYTYMSKRYSWCDHIVDAYFKSDKGTPKKLIIIYIYLFELMLKCIFKFPKDSEV